MKEDADATDPQSTEALQRTSQTFDVTPVFGQRAEGRAHSSFGLRWQGAEPI
jgi:hypothetical protein